MNPNDPRQPFNPFRPAPQQPAQVQPAVMPPPPPGPSPMPTGQAAWAGPIQPPQPQYGQTIVQPPIQQQPQYGQQQAPYPNTGFGRQPAGDPNAWVGVGQAPNNEGGGGPKVTPGIHLLQLVESKVVYSAQRNTQFFVNSFAVCATNNAAAMPRVGERVDNSINRAHQSALSNARRFLAAAFNVPFERVGDDLLPAICHPTQPARGVFLVCLGEQITTKAGRPFTKCRWRFVDPAQAQAIASAILAGSYQFPLETEAEKSV